MDLVRPPNVVASSRSTPDHLFPCSLSPSPSTSPLGAKANSLPFLPPPSLLPPHHLHRQYPHPTTRKLASSFRVSAPMSFSEATLDTVAPSSPLPHRHRRPPKLLQPRATLSSTVLRPLLHPLHLPKTTAIPVHRTTRMGFLLQVATGRPSSPNCRWISIASPCATWAETIASFRTGARRCATPSSLVMSSTLWPGRPCG